MMAKSNDGDKPLNGRIGFRVMRARRQCGLTIRALAASAGIHENTLDRAEKGYGITASTLVKIANALDMTLEELFPKTQYVVGFSARRKKPAKVASETRTLF